MDEGTKSLLEDAAREVAENAQAARTVRPIVHEPLMARIDRDRKRRKRANAIVITMVAGTAIVLAVVGVVAALDSAPEISPGGLSWHPDTGWCCLGPLVPLGFAALVAGVLAWMRPPNVRRAAQLFSARLAGQGEVPNARRALADMSLTVGLPKPPPLYVMDTDSLNAFAVGKSVDACAMGVTRAMADTLSADELRAVFAHLFARVVIGSAARGDNDEALPVQADAEAMYLLRDPRAMLSALERVLGARTTVAASGFGVVTAHFFAPWMELPDIVQPLASVVGEDVGDRIERLRAILGADGVGT